MTLTTPATTRPDEAETASRTGLSAVLRYDLPASLVVFLVALPLSLGIAVASDAPVVAGLIAAAVGGIVAGALGGSPLQVSGPAAGLTVIVAGLVAEFGWLVTCAITVCAGFLQVIFGLTRVGRAALAISPMVVHAMLAGIGVTIALQQIHVLLGGESHSSAWHNIIGLPLDVMHANVAGAALGALVIVVMVAWRRAPARLRTLPGPLVAIVAATLVSLALALDVPRIELGGSIVDALHLPALPDGRWGAFAAGVLTVALIASVESLLTAVAVDRMQTRSRSDLDRELVGQGAANMVSGAIGGLPITGVIVRSSANVAAGARTKASNMLHGVWVLVFALPFAGLVELIPTAALAGLLVVIGVQLVKITHIADARRNGDIAIYAATLAGVVFLDLLQGVLLGLALSVLLTTWRLARAHITVESGEGQIRRVVVTGALTFLSLPRLHETLSSLPPGAKVELALSTTYVDNAAREYLEAWRRGYLAGGGSVVTVGSALPADPTPAAPAVDVRPAVAPVATLPVARSAPRPRALVITCTDPGIRPADITGIDADELVVIRNIGNLAPAGRLDPATEAAISLAVSTMKVPEILVCGHADCTAMRELLGQDEGTRGGDRRLTSWLAHAETARAAFRGGRHPLALAAAERGFDRVDQLGFVNVAVQADIVAQHPLVREARQRGELEVTGLFVDGRGDGPASRVLPVMSSSTGFLSAS